jgi:hypothetical protein
MNGAWGDSCRHQQHSIQICWKWYTQWLYKRIVVSSIMIRHMIKQTNHKPPWHLLIDNNLNSFTLGSYWPWRCGIFKFTICFVWLCCHGAVVLTLRVSNPIELVTCPPHKKKNTRALQLYLIWLWGPISGGDVALSRSKFVLFGCVVMAPLSCPWESPKPIELVMHPHNVIVEYQRLPMIPHLTQGSYWRWRCGTFKFKIRFVWLLSWHYCLNFESLQSPLNWFTCPLHIKVEYQSFTMIPHSTEGSY